MKWLFTIIYDYLWLLMITLIINDYLWLFMIICGYLWLFLIICGCYIKFMFILLWHVSTVCINVVADLLFLFICDYFYYDILV